MISKRDAGKFFWEIGKETATVDATSSIEEVKDFCKDIWSEEKEFSEYDETYWWNERKEVTSGKE